MLLECKMCFVSTAIFSNKPIFCFHEKRAATMAEQLQAVVGQLLGEIENVDSLSNLDTLAFKAALAWKNYKDTQDQV